MTATNYCKFTISVKLKWSIGQILHVSFVCSFAVCHLNLITVFYLNELFDCKLTNSRSSNKVCYPHRMDHVEGIYKKNSFVP